jgi:hypothetical protein
LPHLAPAQGGSLKKNARIFRLNRETLRRLATTDLRQMVGGIKATGVPTACDAASGCRFTLCLPPGCIEN